jgi:hypothetical protein
MHLTTAWGIECEEIFNDELCRRNNLNQPTTIVEKQICDDLHGRFIQHVSTCCWKLRRMHPCKLLKYFLYKQKNAKAGR